MKSATCIGLKNTESTVLDYIVNSNSPDFAISNFKVLQMMLSRLHNNCKTREVC